MAASILSTKNRSLHPLGQVQALVRIARRATAKADWIEWEAPRPDGEVLSDSDRAEVARWRARAQQATDEVLQVVRDNPDAGWTAAQKAAAR